MALNVVTSINIANPGATVLTTKIVQTFLKVFEPNLVFWQFSEAPISERGYNSVTWNKPQRLELTPAQAELSPGITPTETAIKLDSITTTAKQYGLYVVLSDEVLDRFEGRNLPSLCNTLIMANLARIVDRVVQDEVLDNAVNRFYAATTPGGVRAANRAAITPANKIFMYDITEASRILESNYAPYIDNSYFSIMNTNVYFNLQVESTINGGFIDVHKYKNPEDIYKGEIGMRSNVRIIRSPFVKSYVSTTKVYPTVFFGGEAYGASMLQNMQVIVKPLGSGGTTDPLNQRMTIGGKVFFSSKILQQASIVVFESAGADSV